jgi:nitrite reductase/ring-hydroxylating ferredoxin subunit
MTDFIEAIAPLRSAPGAGTSNVDGCPHVGVYHSSGEFDGTLIKCLAHG